MGLGGSWGHREPPRAEDWGGKEVFLGQCPSSCLPGGPRHRDREIKGDRQSGRAPEGKRKRGGETETQRKMIREREVETGSDDPT